MMGKWADVWREFSTIHGGSSLVSYGVKKDNLSY